jgi:hypothetical protein
MRPSGSPSAVPGAATALLLALAASFALLLARPAASSCDAAVQAGSVVYTDAHDRIDRFDLAAGLPLPSVPAPGYGATFDAFAVHGETLWIALSFDGWLVQLGASGAELRRVRTPAGATAVAAEADHVFVLGTDFLASYDAGTGEPEDSVAASGHHRRLLVLPGGRLLLHGRGTPVTVPYGADGALGASEPLFPEGLFSVESFQYVSADGLRLVGGGHVFDAQTLRFVEKLPGSAVFLGDRVVTSYAGLRLYDGARRWIGVAPDPTGGYGLPFAADESLWVLRCDALDPVFAPVSLDDFLPPPAPGEPVDPAGLEYEPQRIAMGDEGVAYLSTYSFGDGRQLLRFDPAAGGYLASVPLREAPRAVTRAPGGGVLLTYLGGRVGRIPAGAAEEAPFAFVPDANAVDFGVLDAAPWLVAGDGRRWHAYGADGAWRAGFAGSAVATAVAWDASRRRLLERLTTLSGEATALPLSEDGVFGERAALAEDFPSDVAMSVSPDGSRLLASGTLYDLESSIAVASLPPSSRPGGLLRALWQGERLVTLAGDADSWGSSRYAEWTKDGVLLASLDAIPGLPLAVLPLGARAVLVRQLDDRPVFTVVAPGTGDLDEDGSPDGLDLFPLDATDWADRDGDGVGDHADRFPDDPIESADADGDGLGDQGDLLPDLAALAFARVTGRETLGFAGLGRLKGDFAGQLHLLQGGGFALCNARESCLGGTARPAGQGRPERLELRLAPASLDALRAALEPGVRQALRGLDVKLRFVASRRNGSVEEGEGGSVRIRLRARHRARIARVGAAPGAYRVDASGVLETAPARAPAP